MKVVVAGSRRITDYNLVCKGIRNSGFTVTEIVSGTCRGADLLGERYAREHNIPVKQFPPDWNKHGKRAGPIRNRQMAEYGDSVIAFLTPDSRGTRSRIAIAEELHLPTYIVHVRGER